MDLHLFTSDVSGLALAELLPPGDRFTLLVVPGNRRGSAKLGACIEAARLPVREHRPQAALDRDLPPAEAAASWLYPQIIDESDLRRYPAGILNMHGGKIPEYRGANVLQWAIINGERELSVSWHEIVAEVDAGPIWAEGTVPIPPAATAADVRADMIAEGLRLFPDAWARFRTRTGAPRRPDLTAGRVWPPRRPADGRLAPGLAERRVRDTVRALCPPWPLATVEHDGAWLPVAAVLDAPAPGAIRYRTAEGRDLWLSLAPACAP